MKYRKKPVVIEATQWHKHGDHPSVEPLHLSRAGGLPVGAKWTQYGWVKTLEGGHVVTPGDWIITGVQGENYPCKAEIFASTYEPA